MTRSSEELELAAKAAGYDIDWDDWRDCGSHIEYRMRGTTRYWSPLTDDGDALRLAVKLNMTVQFRDWWCSILQGKVCATELAESYESREATARRAIVRAAADIGRAMK